jgi:hypothetical protein
LTKNSKFKIQKKNNNIVPMIFENFNVLHTNFIFDFVLQCIKLFMFLQVCCMSSKQSLECHFCLCIEKMIDYQQGSKGRLWIIDLLNLKLVKNSIVVCIVKELFFVLSCSDFQNHMALCSSYPWKALNEYGCIWGDFVMFRLAMKVLLNFDIFSPLEIQ